MSPITRSAFDSIRNGRVENHTHLAQTADPKCEELQENARLSGHFITHGPTVESQLKPLTARQLTAINLLTLGKSVVAVAASLKLDPSTIHRWKSSSPLFIAELNRRQVDAFDSLIVKMRLLMGSAVDELFQIMKSPSKSDRHEVMWKMLAMLKPQKSILPTGPTEPEDVIDEQIRRARAARGEIAEAPIEEEERLAHVRAEDLVEAATCADDRTPRHAERSEASGAIERNSAKSSSNTTRRAKTTPLPSRECDRQSLDRGLGEGAGGDRNVNNENRATATTKEGSQRDAVDDAGPESSFPHVDSSQILHEHAEDDATKIGDGDVDDTDSHPLPRPLPRGEGSQKDSLCESKGDASADMSRELSTDSNSTNPNAHPSPATGSLPEHPCPRVPRG